MSKMPKKRKSWSLEEKLRLIDALKFSIVKGYRGDNGFKPGLYVFCESQLKETLPDVTISAIPHIRSMIHVWKRHHTFLSGILSKSGVNWNPMLKKVECSTEAWDEGCKAFAEMKNKHDESWPFYEDWIEIFGKDRATGDNSLDFAEAVQEILNINPTSDPITAANPAPTNPTTAMGVEDLIASSVPDNGDQVIKDAGSDSGATMSKNKRKASSIQVEDPYKEVISGFLDKTDDALIQILKHLAPNNDDERETESIYTALDAFGLTVAMKVLIGRKLATNREERKFFFSLPHEARKEMITQMQKAL